MPIEVVPGVFSISSVSLEVLMPQILLGESVLVIARASLLYDFSLVVPMHVIPNSESSY